jgi:hypothetical protein
MFFWVFFKKSDKSLPISFIINEFSNLFSKNPDIIKEFINTLHLLKNYSIYCAHSFALMGNETTKQLLVQTQLTLNNVIVPNFFSKEETRELLI